MNRSHIEKEIVMLRTPVFKFIRMGMLALLILAFLIVATGAQPAQAATFACPSSASAAARVVRTS
jgi:hypothetical protein